MAPRGTQIAAVAASIALTSIGVLGWKLHVFALYLAGLPGAIAAYAVTGPHGGSHVQELIGGAAFIVVNLLVYGFLGNLLYKRLLRRKIG